MTQKLSIRQDLALRRAGSRYNAGKTGGIWYPEITLATAQSLERRGLMTVRWQYVFKNLPKWTAYLTHAGIAYAIELGYIRSESK